MGAVAGQVYTLDTAFQSAPSYSDGKVAFSVYEDDYRSGNSKYTNNAAFTVTLPKALDLESGNDGIKIKAYVSPGSRVGAVSLELFKSDDRENWHNWGVPTTVSVTIGDGSAKTEGEVELLVTNEQLATLGYKTGDTVLTFGIRCGTTGNTRHNPTYTLAYQSIALDYIEYYKEGT